MKEKDLIIQDTEKSLVKKANKKQDLIVNEKKEKSLKSVEKKENALKTVIKKETALTKTPAKTTRTRKSTKSVIAEFTAHANEYFELPYRYNETTVKLLAQTPKRLFVYWDIADKDRENYIATFGNDFFEKTIPFLRIVNKTQNYTFDVDINDFANSWYIDVNDDNSKYSIELYRRFKDTPVENTDTHTDNNTIFVASSNGIEAPNGKIISTVYPRVIQYRNIKTDEISYKNIESASDDLYKLLPNEESYNAENNASSSR